MPDWIRKVLEQLEQVWGQTHSFLGKAAQIFPGLMLLGLDLLDFCQCFHAFVHFELKTCRIIFEGLPFVSSATRRILSHPQPTRKPFCNETLKTMTPQPSKPVSACCWQDWQHNHSGYYCATMRHSNCVEWSIVAQEYPEWQDASHSIWKLENGAADDVPLKTWPGQPVPCIRPGCICLNMHQSIQFWH